MTGDARLTELLSALPLGQSMWLRAGGRSMWPLLLEGDRLLVERAEPAALQTGDIAVLRRGGVLIAHIVQATSPLVTVSSVGTPDAPADVPLGRVVSVKRRGRRVDVPDSARLLVQQLPRLAVVLRRLPGARSAVRRLRGW